jgi:hypothetical protein
VDGISFGYLGPSSWLYLRHLCDGNAARLDAAGALAHARQCRQCAYSLAEIGAGRGVRRVAGSGPATVTLTELLPAMTA